MDIERVISWARKMVSMWAMHGMATHVWSWYPTP